jgi:hypothetical protein
MKIYEALMAIYERSKGDETVLQVFLDLERNHGMTGVKRSDFETRWDECRKWPLKFKLDIITMRQDELGREVCEAMLACDPPWDEVVDFAKLIKHAKETPRGLPEALEALAEHRPDVAASLRARCEVEFPVEFNAAKDD